MRVRVVVLQLGRSWGSRRERGWEQGGVGAGCEGGGGLRGSFGCGSVSLVVLEFRELKVLINGC